MHANYYQHVPFLKSQEKEFGYDFVNMGKIHIEPIAGYSKKYKNIDQLPDGAQVLMSSSVSDQSRILTLLDQKGLIQLKKGTGYNGTFKDIVKNPKHLKFKHDIDPSLMAKTYQNGEGDLVFMNTNFAIDAGLNPLKDSTIIEVKDSPYANIVAVQKKDADNQAIKTLVKVLQSQKIKKFIFHKWNGSIVPVELKDAKNK